MIKYLLFIILIFCILVKKDTEYFTSQFCKLSNFDSKPRFTPIQMIIKNIQPVVISKEKSQVINNMILSVPQLINILEEIPKKASPNNFMELPGFRYNLIDPPKITYVSRKMIDLLPKKLFKLISKKLLSVANKNKIKCNKNTPCLLRLKKIVILKVGKNNKNHCIEGQLLLSEKDRSFEYLIRFVISDIDNMQIHYLKLEGYDFYNHFDDKITYDNVKIYSEPIINTYNAKNTYMISSNENKILPSKKISYRVLNNKLNEGDEFKCYGKYAINKNDCQAVYDSVGNKNKQIGIWDKQCNKDSDCPFYKANKNYPNNFGGCKNFQCVMPLGIKNRGPTKYMNIDEAICNGCKQGVHCCASQKNRKLYPKLKSPDYRFLNDEQARANNSL